MILSVSRRTDIPNYYSEWFLERLKEGFLYVKNPFNAHQISKISILPQFVDCIVFWTKNPQNMIKRLDELKNYHYYFQFTLTGYGRDIEPNLPNKRGELIGIFQELSKRIGHEKIIWRYDPILCNDKYKIQYHLKAFKEIAESLNGFTDRVIISFVDLYAKIDRNMKALKLEQLTEDEMFNMASEMAEIAKKNHMDIESCAEKIDLTKAGISYGSCIDKNLIEKITGYPISGAKDINQRELCGCLESIEVGAYNTCKNGCKYCYANYSDARVETNSLMYDRNSPLLCGFVGENDIITERKIKILKK